MGCVDHIPSRNWATGQILGGGGGWGLDGYYLAAVSPFFVLLGREHGRLETRLPMNPPTLVAHISPSAGFARRGGRGGGPTQPAIWAMEPRRIVVASRVPPRSYRRGWHDGHDGVMGDGAMEPWSASQRI